MSLALDSSESVRLRLRVESAASFADDVADFGRLVPPRGKGRITEHREDLSLRRLLVALFITDRLKLPLTVEARKSHVGAYPDFTITFDDGEVFGVEHTDAGAASWHRWLRETEEETQLYPSNDGYAGDAPERRVVADVMEAIRREVEKARGGACAAVARCDLMIYENSEEGVFVQPREVVDRLRAVHRQGQVSVAPFAHAHLIIGKVVVVDLFGEGCLDIDLSGDYSEDWTGWLCAQAKLIRDGHISEIDGANLVEELEALAGKERRALASRLRRLLPHLLKMRAQPAKSGRSGQRSVVTARQTIEDTLEDSPSLVQEIPKLASKAYGQARRLAAIETDVELDEFPAECPFSIDELLDDDFMPGDRQ